MKYCPICGQKVETYHEVTFDKPYIHNNPYDGIMIYGAYSAPKETLCYEKNFLHFAFYDSKGDLCEHRLVQLNVSNPKTKSPSEEISEYPDEDDDEITTIGSVDDDDELPF